MLYTIAYGSAFMQASMEEWPAGSSAGCVRIAEQMVVSQKELKLACKRLKEGAQ